MTYQFHDARGKTDSTDLWVIKPTDQASPFGVFRVPHYILRSYLQEYEMDMFLRQRWRDPRLAYTRYNHTLTLDFSRTVMLWIPDLFFSNEKKARFHEITVPNRYVRLWPNGELLFSQRLSK